MTTQPRSQNRTVDEQLTQLNAARGLVLKDPIFWPRIIDGILPFVSGPYIELRRWGADFLAETFSTPVVDANEKQKLAPMCLDTLVMLADEIETGILKSVVQCSASIYPLIFRHICQNREDAATWGKMDTLKAKILRLWDTAPAGVRVCCIKFVQRVILVQSKGYTDPRLADRSEISLSMVPTNHPLLSLPALDAEAQGLLDRLLSIFHDDPSDPVLITATLNNLASLVKTRTPIAPKVVSAVLGFNPLAIAARSPSAHNRLMMQCMEKTVRVLLLNIMRSNPSGPFTGRISQHLARISQMKMELQEEASRKRAAPSSEVDATKRLKVTDAIPQNTATPASTPTPTPVPPTRPVQQVITGPMTYAQLYTLSNDVAMTSFDGQQLPLDLVLQIVIGSIYSMSQHNLDTAISAVRGRYNALQQATPPQAPTPAPSSTQDVREMPSMADVVQAETPQMQEETEKEEPEAEEEEERELPLGHFHLPPPPRLSQEQLHQATLDAVERMFSIVEEFDKTSLTARRNKLGINRLAASNWDREAWIMFLSRLATRGLGGLNQDDGELVKSENGFSLRAPSALSTIIREKLYNHVITDFRGRMDIAVAWLNEEWYNDQMMAKSEEGRDREPQYHKWMMKVMDGVFPYLELKDRLIMRLLSEIPEIPEELLQKVKMLCLDPDRAALGIQMLHFLAMLRPPVRELCMDILEDLWRNHSEVRGPAQKLLQKWRPQALQPRIKTESENQVGQNGTTKDESNGISQTHGLTPVNA
ncbi:hypothetical protein RUND412_006537 [Rhizina undulata]